MNKLIIAHNIIKSTGWIFLAIGIITQTLVFGTFSAFSLGLLDCLVGIILIFTSYFILKHSSLSILTITAALGQTVWLILQVLSQSDSYESNIQQILETLSIISIFVGLSAVLGSFVFLISYLNSKIIKTKST